eukprot:488319_1
MSSVLNRIDNLLALMAAPIKTKENIIEDVVLKLFEIGAVKFGEFKLKSGILSPIYLDLRLIVSYPSLLQKISDLMWQQVRNLNDDVICGVPYTALPIATCISIQQNKPMLMRRKEAKKYGTKKVIEGVFKSGQQCLIIEDLVTSGTSVLETVCELNKVGLNVRSAVVLIDRQQGGKENLSNNNIDLYSCYTISTMLEILTKHKKIDSDTIAKVNQFLKDNSSVKSKVTTQQQNKASKRLTFKERSALCGNAIAQKMFQIMEDKQTNLCCSADVKTCDEVLALAENVGPYICLLKTHVDIITDFSEDFIGKLQGIADKYNFLIFEDRKFADIGNTVKSQFGAGIYKIASWTHITNAHSIPGPGIIEGLRQISVESSKGKQVNHGLLLLAEMSSKGNLATNEYTKTTVQYAEENNDFVIGFICRSKLSSDPTLINMTPGVHLEVKGDGIGQQYLTPNKVINQNRSDVIIVGRGIYRSENQAEAAKKYRDAAWKAYQVSLK